MIRYLGRQSLSVMGSIGAAVIFGGESLYAYVCRDRSLARLSRHVNEIGVRTTPLIVLVGLFTGMVLGLQGYHTLVMFGSESVLGSLVALSIVQELGPVLTAIMIVGQAGSGMTAEIGSQRNHEQIDALQVIGVSPLSFLVAPRLLASLISFPILNGAFCLVGIVGGHISAVEILGLDAGVYRSHVVDAVTAGHVWDSMFKASVFGILTILVCCFEGYFTHVRNRMSGERAVSFSATRAVVYSSVLILASDYVISSFQLG